MCLLILCLVSCGTAQTCFSNASGEGVVVRYYLDGRDKTGATKPSLLVHVKQLGPSLRSEQIFMIIILCNHPSRDAKATKHVSERGD